MLRWPPPNEIVDHEVYAPFLKISPNEAMLQVAEYYKDHRPGLEPAFIGAKGASRDTHEEKQNWLKFVRHTINKGIVHEKVADDRDLNKLYVWGIKPLRRMVTNYRKAWRTMKTNFTKSGSAPPNEGSFECQFLEVNPTEVMCIL